MGESKVVTFSKKGGYTAAEAIDSKGGTRSFFLPTKRGSIIIKERAGGSRLYTRTKRGEVGGPYVTAALRPLSSKTFCHYFVAFPVSPGSENMFARQDLSHQKRANTPILFAKYHFEWQASSS